MKGFFLISAMFNFLVVLAFMFGQDLLLPMFKLEANNSAMTFLYLLMSLVAVFGFAYYKIARDPDRYKELILFGAQAKLVLVFTGLVIVSLGLVHWPILLPLSADFVFAIIFIRLYGQLNN